MDLFFVLSGFLIGTQMLAPLARGEHFSFRDCYLKRALRILPAYWVVLLLYLALPEFREAPEMEAWWKFVGFVLNLSIDYLPHQAFSHAWSLCVEEHFYLWLLRRHILTARHQLGLGLLAIDLAPRQTTSWRSAVSAS